MGVWWALCFFELLSGVGEILIGVAVCVAVAAFEIISLINAIKIANKNMGNIKAQDKGGDMEQKSPVKNICAAIFSGLGGLGLFGGFIAISMLIFPAEILSLFAVALISFAFCACAMALADVVIYNSVKAGYIITDNYFLKKAKKEKEQEQNKENEKSKNEEEKVEDKTNENEVNKKPETDQQKTIIPSSNPENGDGNLVPPQNSDPNKGINDF